jgi:hypothetical protein
MREEHGWLTRFEADGLLRRDAGRLRTTKRWQGAMARAALRLAGSATDDLRAPIASALIEIYGESLDDDSVVEAIRAISPIEAGELEAPRATDVELIRSPWS